MNEEVKESPDAPKAPRPKKVMAFDPKYVFTGETKDLFCSIPHRRVVTLHRIIAARDFGDISRGTLGGWIEDENNLLHSGTAWVADEAMVMDFARVEDDARASGHAWITENAILRDHARAEHDVWVQERAHVCDHARIRHTAMVAGDAVVTGDAVVCGDALVTGAALVGGCAMVMDDAFVSDHVHVGGICRVKGEAFLTGGGNFLEGRITSPRAEDVDLDATSVKEGGAK